MEKIIINPENYKEQYIRNLNQCFGNWGGEAEYQWGLERKSGAHSTDIMLIENEEDGVIAGSAVSYRRLRDQSQDIEIGIMTGSWTLPAARRKGCFTKMIRCSSDLCRKKEVPFLTAFVTEENASRRRLESEGSFMFPTHHLFSPETPFRQDGLPDTEEVEKDRDLIERIYDRKTQTQQNLLSFDYTKGEFFGQYINRIKSTTLLKIGKEDFAVLEDGRNEVKILYLSFGSIEDFSRNIMAVSNWCLKTRSRKAFFFTTRKELAENCEENRFQNHPGYFTILSTSEDAVDFDGKFRKLDINMADKM